MVGCVIGVPAGDGARILGIGHHRRYGGPHAEVEALADCARRGADPRGATAWVTLEPCCHTGKTGPCTEALIRAGITKVVFARRDPNPVSGGGAERLMRAGIEVREFGAVPEAVRVSDPFVKRITTGLPWVTVKWAQTIDGRIAARSGDSKWISNEWSRRMVHRLRARVDAVLTGIGTVLADDPLLTARDVPLRRSARRIVIDPLLKLPSNCALVRSAGEGGPPLTVATSVHTLKLNRTAADALRRAGNVEIASFPDDAGELPLGDVLRHLVQAHDATNVFVEAGPGVVSRLLRSGLADAMLVFIGPLVLGDDEAIGPVRGEAIEAISSARRFELLRVRRLGGDAVLGYRVRHPPA